ncbi:hypothetical protein IC607_05750 [Cellulomonas sp. JH27-2]|uniref:hypothetical protein n=1 Tax=Cellulomonas sp. JH27-2 TaxID=2774139 RepID=UPI001780A6EC|nr:hypothetical protein [Cellulomonas sp. JH27-2]MBD8058470.1 hypothetical protein [Cellulomonas sp. JH27-2]
MGVALFSWTPVGDHEFLGAVVMAVVCSGASWIARRILEGPSELRGSELPFVGANPSGLSIVLLDPGDRIIQVVKVLRDRGVCFRSARDATRTEEPLVLALALAPDELDRWSVDLAAAGARIEVRGNGRVGSATSQG